MIRNTVHSYNVTVNNDQSGNSHWYNADSLYGQYICHNLFATYKTEWNLAPSIPNKTAFQWIVDRCN